MANVSVETARAWQQAMVGASGLKDRWVAKALREGVGVARAEMEEVKGFVEKFEWDLAGPEVVALKILRKSVEAGERLVDMTPV